MIRHNIFFEALRQLDADAQDSDGYELWAGVLVLRLCDFWQLDPAVARAGAGGALEVRSVVSRLSDLTPVKRILLRVLDALQNANLTNPHAAQALSSYAAELARKRHVQLAIDVRRSARLISQGRDPRRQASLSRTSPFGSLNPTRGQSASARSTNVAGSQRRA